jgi:hypothetical protein
MDGTDCQIVEGGRDNNKSDSTYGDLIGFVNPPGGPVLGVGTGHSSNPSHDSQIGATQTISCVDIEAIDLTISHYNNASPVPYAFLPNGSTTFNSNSFTFTLLGDIGLGGVFSLPTNLLRGFFGRPFFPGWGYSVPGLNYP